MPLLTDRDLLTLEPNLFRDVSFLGQQVFRGTCSIVAGVLTAETGDLAAAGVTAGHVAVIDEIPYEIIERTSDTTAAVSLARPARDSTTIVPPDLSSRPAIVTSFAPQIALVHGQLLRLLGLDASTVAADASGRSPGESAITNPDELRLSGALGTLHLVYSAASALFGPDSPAGRRSEMYRLRSAAERRRARIQIDTDNDGRADATRTLAVIQLVR
jgi:hypothetical protein